MDLEYSTMSSDGSSAASEVSQESTRLEDCRIQGLNLKLPQELCENKQIFKEFFSLNTWNECFTEQQKEHLKTFLPTFPENDAQEKEETLRRLFNRENMKFGSPLTDFHNCLKNGYYRPDVAKIRSLMRKAQFREYKHQQRKYYFRLMKEILLSRQKLLETAFNQPPGTIPKMERIPQHTVPVTTSAEQRTRRRYFQELAAIRQEVGESDHSSEDDNYPEGPPPRLSKKQKRQLATLECLLSPDMRRVTSTLALKPVGFDLEVNVTANHNPYEMNEEAYKTLLLNHKRRRMEGDDHPELNILGITTQDIEMRAQLSKRPPISRAVHNSGDQKVVNKKKIKTEPGTKVPALQGPLLNSPQPGGGDSSNVSDIDSDEEHSVGTLADEMDRVDVDGDVESPVMTNKTPSLSAPSHGRTPTAAPRNRRTNSSGSSPRSSKPSSGSGTAVRSLLQNRIKIEPTEEESTAAANSIQPQQQVPSSTSIASNVKVQAPSFSNRQITAATLSDLDGIDMMNLPVDLDESPNDPLDITLDDIKPTPELMQETHACFFSLIRDVICSTPDHRMSLSTLEDRLKAWQENPISPLNDWYCIAADSWLLLLSSAVSFLCGDYPDAQPEDYVPYLEYKPQIQTYQWIGAGRDSDSHLQPLCQHWLDHRDEMTARPIKEEEIEEEVSDVVGEERAASPPPPRCPTAWVVRPSTTEEKEAFREQERLRYENPHRAFTFRMHGYESVVGPVKGVYNQSIGANKPRGHSLLVAERPNFVTILALVRDATARLPNGEGTRTDICELLKDSQYLAPIAQESDLHSVVSGALDRLHYETDPCVKYDTKRKIWIYLHRGRTEEEFERLHQQQQGMAKTKKSSSQRKASRSKKESGKDAAANAAATTGASTNTQQERTEAAAAAAVCSSSGVLTTNTTTAQTVVAASNKPVATVARVARASVAPRTFTLATGQTVQNLQVSTSSGLHTIQVTTTPAGKSLLTSQAQQNLAVTAGSSVMKTMTATAQGVATSAGGQVLKAVTLTAQQMQAVNAARGITPTTTAAATAMKSPSISTASATSALRMPTSPLVGNTTATQGDNLLVVTKTSVATCGRATTSTVATSPTQASHVLQQLPLQSQQRASIKTTSAPSMPSPKSVVSTAAGAQVVNVSQVQLLGAKSPQPMLTAGGKTIVTAGLTGMKLVNAVKAIATSEGSQPQQQTIYIKQQKQQQQQQQQQLLLQQSQTDQQQSTIGTIRQPQQIAPQQLLQKQVNKQQAASFSQLQQQMKQQLQQQKQQQQQQAQQTSQQPNTTTTTTATSVVTSVPNQPHRVVTTMSVLGQGQTQQRVMARVGGKPIPVSHMTLPVQLQQQTPTTTGASASTITTQQQQQQPVVAKVLTNAQGQVISMESLLAHQKQHGTLPQGTALRVTTGGKPGQTSLIQIPSTTPGGVAQFAVVSQGNLLSVGQPRVLQAQIPTQQSHSANAGGMQQPTMVALQPQQQQQPNSKLVTATTTTKPLVAGTATTATANLRMLGPAAAGSLNLAHIGGKPVLLASKAQPTPIQGAPGQNVILTSQAAGGHQTVVLASQAIRAQGSTLVLQQGGAQQILLPPGFQSGTLNIKTLQGLQGLKVIPLSQATAGAANKGRQQVYARIISPGLRPATANIIHPNPGGVPTAVTLQATTGDSGTTSSTTAPQQAGTGTSGSAEQ